MQQQQRMAALIFGLCLAAACHGGAAVTATARAESQAATWLRARRSAPQQDELAELRAQNPSAYAIVKALLTKRSLGLLDPRHPSASFAPAQGQSQAAEESVPQGPEAFESIAEESGEKPKPQVALAYPDMAAAPAHHDWLNWKPSQSAMDDDAMVKNVLGAVADLKGGQGASTNLRGQGSADSDSDASNALQWNDNAAAVSATPAAPVTFAAPLDVEAKPKAAMSQENSYLKGIDFGFKGTNFGSDSAFSAPTAPLAEAAPAHMAQLGLHAATEKADSHDFLAGFSWDDDAPAQKAPPAAAVAAPTNEGSSEPAKASGGSHGGNALLAWLGGGAPAAAAAPQASATPAPQQSGYLMDLQ